MNDMKGFIAKARAVHGNKYLYKNAVYTGSKSLLTITCKKHGDFVQLIEKHLLGQGCKECGRLRGAESRKKPKSYYIAKAKETHGDVFDYTKTKYTHPNVKVTITCREHGDFQQLMHNHIAGQGCPECKNAKISAALRKPFQEFVQDAKQVHGKKFGYSETNYTGTYITVICKKHGPFTQLCNNHLKGKGCLACKHENRRSKIETSVAKWLSKFTEIQTSAKMRNRELDIFVPEFNLAIEVNGLYWHSEKLAGRNKHQEKTLEAKQYGVKLLTLWEHDIKFKAAIVKSMLLVQLGRATRIFARDTEIRQISAKESAEFLEQNHLQGSCSAKVHLGCFFNGELVGAMTFGHSRFDKSAEWEIARLGWKRKTVIVGGASKFFAAFKALTNPTSVISYADLDNGNGAVYEKLGFIFSHFSTPNYFWVRNLTVLSRYKTQKHKLSSLLSNFDAEKSESANMENAGFYRVFNCGNAVYKWRKEGHAQD